MYLLQSHTKYAWDQDWDSNQFSSLISYIGDHKGANFIFFLWALYRAEFSTDLLQIHTKYSLAQNLDSCPFGPPISYLCGHQGGIFVFCKLKPHIFQIDNKNGFDQDLDPNTFF